MPCKHNTNISIQSNWTPLHYTTKHMTDMDTMYMIIATMHTERSANNFSLCTQAVKGEKQQG